MIEQALLDLDKIWSVITFSLIEYQSSGIYILKALDDIIQQLDDSLTTI